MSSQLIYRVLNQSPERSRNLLLNAGKLEDAASVATESRCRPCNCISFGQDMISEVC